MTRALIVTWDGGGNLPPALGIGREIQDRGGTVRVIGHPRQRERVEGAGLAFEGFRRARPADLAAASSSLAELRDVSGIFADKGMAHDVVDAIDAEPTDVVLVDCLLLGALRAAARTGVPTVSLVHTFQRYLDSNVGRGLVGLLTALRGAPPHRVWRDAVLSLVATLPGLDPASAGRQGDERVRYVGPVWQGTPAPAAPAAGRPKILVSLSTNWFPGQDRTLQTVLDAVGDCDVDAVVTTGPSIDPQSLNAPANAEVHRYLDHGEILPEVSMVVGHGGHSTTMRALSYGVPLLVLPMHVMMDQKMVGDAVASQGAAEVLPMKAGADRIRDAVQRLSGPGSHRAAAARLGAQIREQDGARVAVDHLDQLVAVR